MPGCFALCCPKNFSAQSDPVLFCASDNKRLEYCVHVYGPLFVLSEGKRKGQRGTERERERER